MKSKLNNLFFYIGKTFNNYDMLLTCMKTELSQRRYDTAKKIIASLKKIDSSRLDDFMEEFFYTSVMEDDVQNLDFLIETGYTCSYTGSYTGDTYSYGYIEDTPTLIWAIQNKRTKCAKKLFEAGFDVNELDENYCTAFLWAVKEESLSLVKTFIEKADINTQDSFGNTPLLSAVQNKNEQITKLLIKKKANQYFVFSKLIEQKDISLIKWFVEKGADINTQNKDGNFAETRFNWWVEQQNKDGKSALHLAVKKNDMKLVKFFIESGADIAIQDEQGHTAFHLALKENNIEFIKVLLEAGANVNSQIETGESALYFAVKKNDITLATHLLKAGADVNIQTNNGTSVLHLAVLQDSIELVKLLLKAGADINLQNDNGETALHLGIHHFFHEENKVNLIKTLLNSGADVNIQTNNGTSALHQAVQQGYKQGFIELVKLLLKAGADINQQNNDGNTVLHLGIQHLSFDDDELNLIKILLKSGADVNISNNIGWTVLHFLALNHDMIENYKKILHLLLSTGADINAQTTDGTSVLHLAVRDDAGELVKLLLDNGADKDLPDHSGKTAFDYAIQRHHKNIARLLNPDADIETLTMLSNLIEKQNQIVLEQQNSKQEQQNAIHALSGELNNLRKDFIYEQQKTRTVQEQQHKERLEIEEERLRREKERRNNEFFMEKWKQEEEKEWREEVLKKLS